jgi:hypothetical protein
LALLLATWTAGWIAYDAHRFGILMSWHFFAAGARRLVGLRFPGYVRPGGLDLFASYPKLQIGPAAFLVALPLAVLPSTAGEVLAAVLMLGAGALIAVLVADAARRATGLQPPPMARSLAFALVAPLWVSLSFTYGHLDDVLALTCVTAGINAAVRGRFQLCAVLVGLSAAAKPWAFAFLPLVLLAPRTQRVKAGAVALLSAVIGWVPFLVADPHTLRAAAFKIRVVPASVLGLIGITGGTPSWVRPVQFIVGAALVALCVRHRRYAGAVAVALALRLAIDPNVYPYYMTGLLVATALWDLIATRINIPIMTTGCFLALYLPDLTRMSATTRGGLLLAAVVAVPIAVAMKPPQKALDEARSVPARRAVVMS